MYTNVSAWSRDVTYFNVTGSNVFVVYDRTTTATCSGITPRMAWHFPGLTAPTPSGTNRYWITDSNGFKGAITSALISNPGTAVNPSFTLANVFNSNKLRRISISPATCATDLRWVTVLDPATSSGALHGVVELNLANAKGVKLTSPGSNKVALYGAGTVGQTISGSVAFSTPVVTNTKLVVADLLPSTSYVVTAPPSGGNHAVTITQGASSLTTTEEGTLHVNINAAGQVTQGN